MAKTIIDEKLKLSIIIDGNPAQQELFKLEKATRQLNQENKELRLEKGRLEKAGKTESERYKEITATLKANTAAINANKAKMSELQKEIGIMGMTMGQLKSRATLLRNTLTNMLPGSADYKRYTAELSAITDRLNQLKGKATAAKLSLSSIADGFNKYAALGASIIALFTGVALTFQKMIDYNGKLSDAQADVMKTTGMTKKEVDELTKSFGLLETRTSRIDLLKIAEQGGRIGIAKEEIGDFVDVMNKANVALGDSFTGGAEEVANKLGKIKFLFSETKDMRVDQAYNSIGSAINELGANGVASETNIADFTTRIGSLTDVLKPTIQETLALGAAFEESGIEAEVSSRAYNIFMKQASTEAAKFGKVMNMSKKEVEGLINANPLEFMLQFAQGMRGMNATETAKTLDYLGINADGANKAIGAMGNNVERFRELINLSNGSFAEGTSLINEYDIKNNNLAATLEKVQKRIVGAFSSEVVVNWLADVVNWLAKFIGATEDSDGSVTRWRNTLVFLIKILSVAIVSLVSYKAGLQLATLWSNRMTQANLLSNIVFRIQYALLVAQTVATHALSLAKALLTGNLVKARAAWVAMSVAMSVNPFGALLAVLGAVAGAYMLFRKETEKVANTQKLLSDIHLEATKNIAKEKSELELLTRIAKDETLSKEDRLRAINKLNDIIPDYIGFLTLENIKMEEGTTILKKYTEELYKNARAKAVKNQYDTLVEDRVKVEQKSVSEYASGFTKFFAADEYTKLLENVKSEADLWKIASDIAKKQRDQNGKNFIPGTKEFYKQMDFVYGNLKADLGGYLDEKAQELSIIDAKIKALEPEAVKATIAENKNDENAPKKSSFTVQDGDDKAAKKRADEAKKRLEELKKMAEERLRLEREAEDAILANMSENYQKEWQIEQSAFTRRIQDLKNRLVSEADIKEAYAKADNTKLSAEERKYWKQSADNWVANNKHVHSLIESNEVAHGLRLNTIKEKALKNIIDKEKEEYELQKLIRDTEFNNQLAQLGANEKAKDELKKQHQDEELKADEEFLLVQIERLNSVLAGATIDGVDFSLLPDDQRKKIEEQIQFLLNALSKLNEAKSGKKISEFGEAGMSAFGNQDILGFTYEQWDEVFQKLDTLQGKMQATSMVVQGLQNLWGAFGNFMKANEDAQLRKFENNSDAKKKRLKSQLDNGMINQAQYKKGVENLDAELAKQKADLEYKQAKRQRTMAIVDAVMNTAKGVTAALGMMPPLSFVFAGLTAAMGALQIATIAKQPLPAKGYEDGLYPGYIDVVREQDGKKFRPKNAGKLKSGLVTQNSLMVAEGNKPEMIIDNKSWRKLDPGLKEMLIRDLRGVRGFEKGYYKDDVVYSGNSTPKESDSSVAENQLLMAVYAMLKENTEVMREIKDSGILAIVSSRDMKSMKEIKEGIEKIKENRDKAKIS